MFEGRRVTWYRPTSLAQLLRLRNKFPHTVTKGQPLHRIVMGNTEIGKLSLSLHRSRHADDNGC